MTQQLRAKRFHPIELQLDLNQGLLVKKENSIQKISPKDLTNSTNKEIHQGLLSELLYRSQNGNDQIRLMICVTMYNEPIEDLTKSIQGITASLEDFFEHGFLPHQIAVFVMFDGIEHVNNGKNNQNEDVISYFSGHFDENYNIEKDMTLKRQHKQYTTCQKNKKDFSKAKREYYCAKRIVGKIFKEHQKILEQKLASGEKQAQQKQEKTQKNPQQIEEEKKQMKQSHNNQQQNQKVEENQTSNNNPPNPNPNPEKQKISVASKIQCMKQVVKESKTHIQNKKNSALVYQDQYDFKYSKQDEVSGYMPIFYVFKYENGQKLSSHMWFFKGFCELLKPEYCLLMDAGAIPKEKAICKLIFAMAQNDKIGGVCGTMRIDLSQKKTKGDYVYKDIFTKYLQRIFSIKRCQSCEYDIGHIFDKSFESSMNFIHVLPGAFSGYRYKAFTQKYGQDSSPEIKTNILDIYLQQVLDKDRQMDSLQEANMFLAEDRVLCSLLFCNGYYLRYVRDAFVKVDPQISVFDLILQRKRWINGTWFALNYVVENFKKHMNENLLTRKDKWLFILNLTFAKMSQLQQYFLLSFQTVWNYMILDVIFSPQNRIIIFKTDDEIYNAIMKQLFIAVYIFLVLMLIFLSLSYNLDIFDSTPDQKLREQQKREAKIFFVSKFYGVSTLLGLMSLFTVGFTIYLFYTEIIKQGKLFDFYDYPYIPSNYLFLFVVISIFFQSLPYIIWLCVEFRMVFSILYSLIHYFYFLPTYTHLFQIFAFCRIDDLSWGTKGLSANKTFNSETEQTYEKFYFLCKWIVLNSLVTTIIFILFYLQINLIFAIIILSFTVIFTLVTIMKSIGAIIYQFCYRGFVQEHPVSTKQEIQQYIERVKEHMNQINKLYSE